jgi:hypothetical protein
MLFAGFKKANSPPGPAEHCGGLSGKNALIGFSSLILL